MDATESLSGTARGARRRKHCSWRVGACCALAVVTAVYCMTGFKGSLLSTDHVQQFLISTWSPRADSAPRRPPKLALAIQGTASNIPIVRNILARMETRSRVDVFYLAWQGDEQQAGLEGWSPREEDPLVQVMFDQGTTWTTGRNKLASAIFAEEARRKALYRAWGFVDLDTFVCNCIGCPPAAPADSADQKAVASACCWDYVARDVVLANHTGFATYSNSMSSHLYVDFVQRHQGDVDFLTPRVLLNKDCSDAQLQIFDRDAVPVLLPYHADLDGLSWWSSQATLYFYTSGCLKGANAVLPRQIGPLESQHKPYPQGRDRAGEQAIVASNFPKLMSFPFNQTGCMDQDDPADFKIADLREELPSPNKDWRTSAAFLACLRVKEPYFLQAMQQAGEVP